MAVWALPASCSLPDSWQCGEDACGLCQLVAESRTAGSVVRLCWGYHSKLQLAGQLALWSGCARASCSLHDS
jgi:hypothetical protein